MLALTPPPDRTIPVLWQNLIRKFNVPGRLDTVPSAHSRSLVSVRLLPQTCTPLHVGAKCGRPRRGSNRAPTTGTSVVLRRFNPLGHGGDILPAKQSLFHDDFSFHDTTPTILLPQFISMNLNQKFNCGTNQYREKNDLSWICASQWLKMIYASQ